jgi:hypothetical protein
VCSRVIDWQTERIISKRLGRIEGFEEIPLIKQT